MMTRMHKFIKTASGAVVTTAAVVAAAASVMASAPDCHISHAERYHSLALEARKVNNYQRAKGFFEDMLASADSIADDEQRKPYVFKAHSGLRDVCLELEEYDESIAHGRYCVDSFRTDSTFRPHDASLSYALLGSVYVYAGRVEQAYACVDSAMNLLNADSPEMYRRSIPKMLGIVAANSGDWALAELAYRRGLEIERSLPLAEERVGAVNLLANALCQQDRYQEALPLYREQEALSREIFGEDSDQALHAAYQITNVLAFAGDVEGACRQYIDVGRQYAERLRGRLRVAPGEKREAMIADFIKVMRAMTPFGVAAGANDDEFTMAAYNGILSAKGLLLWSEMAAEKIINRHGSPADRSNLDRLNALKTRLTALEAGETRRSEEIAGVYSEILQLDSMLAGSCAGYGDIGGFLDHDYREVCSRLAPGEVVVDYYDYHASTVGRKYVAYVYRGGQRYPHRVEICRQSQIDSVVNLEKGIMSNLYGPDTGEAMRRLLLAPLSEWTADARRVYIVPSGQLHNIALESLPSPEGGLVSDHTEYVRISSAREIGRPARQSTSTSSLFGGADYSGSVYAALPGSLSEVSEIGGILGSGASIHTAGDASSARLAALSGNSPGILHISTHGFFYEPGAEDIPDPLKGYGEAMDLCGLVMSDRMLSASEIASWDLGDTSLVCLASCHTGLGKITSEGVYGLQRAFKRAGAGSILLSLWEASDNASHLFMAEFYRAMQLHGASPRMACNAARNKVKEQYPHPFYWAGYVIVD